MHINTNNYIKTVVKTSTKYLFVKIIYWHGLQKKYFC